MTIVGKREITYYGGKIMITRLAISDNAEAQMVDLAKYLLVDNLTETEKRLAAIVWNPGFILGKSIKLAGQTN